MKITDTKFAIDCKIDISLSLAEAAALSWPAKYSEKALREALSHLSPDHAKSAELAHTILRELHVRVVAAQTAHGKATETLKGVIAETKGLK